MNISGRFRAMVLPAAGVAMLLWCCAIGSVARAQAQATAPPPAGARLEIVGTATPLTLSAVELKALPRTSVRVGGQSGQAAQSYEGVALAELLRRAGVPEGDDLGGPWMGAYVLATAADGYRAAFSLAELTSGLGSTEVLVADTLDGAPLAGGLGPFRLVVPTDKRAARWVRAVRSISIEGM